MQTPVWGCRFAFTQIFINISLNFREMKIICAQKYHYNQSNSTRNCSIHEIDWRGRLVQFSPTHPSKRINKRLGTLAQCTVLNNYQMIFTSNIIIVFFYILFAVHLVLMFIVTPNEGVKSRAMFTMYSLSPDFVTSVEAEVSLLNIFFWIET